MVPKFSSLAPGEQKASFLNICIGRGQRWDKIRLTCVKNIVLTWCPLNDKWFQKFRYR